MLECSCMGKPIQAGVAMTSTKLDPDGASLLAVTCMEGSRQELFATARHLARYYRFCVQEEHDGAGSLAGTPCLLVVVSAKGNDVRALGVGATLDLRQIAAAMAAAITCAVVIGPPDPSLRMEELVDLEQARRLLARPTKRSSSLPQTRSEQVTGPVPRNQRQQEKQQCETQLATSQYKVAHSTGDLQATMEDGVIALSSDSDILPASPVNSQACAVIEPPAESQPKKKLRRSGRRGTSSAMPAPAATPAKCSAGAAEARPLVDQNCRRSPRIAEQAVQLALPVMQRFPKMTGFQAFCPQKISSGSTIGQVTEPRLLEGKGWCLFPKENHEAFEEIGTEVPLLKCSPKTSDEVRKAIAASMEGTSIEADLVYGALHVLRSEPELQKSLRVLFAPDPDSATQEAMQTILRHLYGEFGDIELDKAAQLGKLYNALSLNSFSTSASGRSFVSFEILSRISHSCQPNCEVIVQSNGSGRLVALTKISAGEELRISYLGEDDLKLDKRSRRQLLLKKWGFRCNCRKCKGLTG